MRRLILPIVLMMFAQQAAAEALLEGRLSFLLTVRQELAAGRMTLPELDRSSLTDPSELGNLAPWIAAEQKFPGSVRFHAAPGADDFAALRELGVEFFDFGNGPAGSRTVYPARIPFTSLPDLIRYPALAMIDCAWRPGARPTLAQSRPQVEAELAWQVDDPDGVPLSGDGVVICDLDTGILYYHPAFFDLDGQQYDWLDVDQSGDLTPGDAVDLDDDELPGAGEALLYHEASGTAIHGNGPGYDTDFDFLYNDANDNGERDYGPPEYDETDPCFGERYFLTDDINGNGSLDVGEPLLGLGPSKVRAIYDRDGTVYRREVDLLDAEADYWGHGTQVSGIFGGGWAWRNAMSGMAPDIESLHVNLWWAFEPPFLLPIEAGLAWARDEGADIVLIEDGEWTWEFMDGSSNTEIMLNELAADDGMIIVIPAGNLATGNMHTAFDADTGTDLVSANAHVVWANFHWIGVSEWWPITVTPPGGSPITLPADGSIVTDQGYEIYGNLTSSDRLTVRQDLRIAKSGGAVLDGTWQFAFAGPADLTVHGYFYDDVSGWISPNTWQPVDPAYTVTFPATADSAISVAAYNPSGDGDINTFSGWGPRLDGRPDVDIAAPGSIVYSAHAFHVGDFAAFGGTSAAGPHVAGAAALLKQLIPDLDNGRFRQLVRAGAGQDEHTDDIDRWGAGKLRIYGAIQNVITAVADEPPHRELALSAYPNPFNPRTTLRFYQPASGTAVLRIFSIDGRQIWSRRLDAAGPGWREVVWDGRDGRDLPVSSGLYFAYLRQGERYAAIRVTLMK